MKKKAILCISLLILGAGFAVYNHTSSSNQNANSVSLTRNDFEMNFFSDKKIYKSTDKIKIWATLKYVGNKDTIRIWHSIPYIIFSITDGKEFNTETSVYTILTSTVLEQGKVYHFNYQKSGGWSKDSPNATFWENFYKEKDLHLPVGEYTVTVRGAFSLTENIVESNSELLCKLKIEVK